MLTTTSARLAAFAATLALAGGAAALAGGATGATPPLQDCLRAAAIRAGLDEPAGGHGEGDEAMAQAVPGADGRRSALAGLSLLPVPRSFSAGRANEVRFRIEDCDGEPLRSFEREQGKRLHLIVTRTDFTAYQHLHPTQGRDGTWSVDVAAPRPGRYRALADFVSDGRKYVLGTTFVAPGEAGHAPLPPARDRAATGGYAVELERPAVLHAGEEAQLTFRVTRDGRPVTGLRPYLGAYGHLVALHVPDLAYSHVHPDGEDLRAGAITFDAELQERGPHRLFMQFRIGGRVRTAAFTLPVT